MKAPSKPARPISRRHDDEVKQSCLSERMRGWQQDLRAQGSRLKHLNLIPEELFESDKVHLAERMASVPFGQRAGLSGAWPCREWPSAGPSGPQHAVTAVVVSCLLQATSIILVNSKDGSNNNNNNNHRSHLPKISKIAQVA